MGGELWVGRVGRVGLGWGALCGEGGSGYKGGRRIGSKFVWRKGVLETWKVWRFEDLEIWRFGSLEIWRFAWDTSQISSM